MCIRDREVRSRLADSLETAISLTGGIAVVDADGEELTFSSNYACPDHDISIEELNPRMFSFNAPYGACDKCTGLGTVSYTHLDVYKRQIGNMPLASPTPIA